MATPNREHPDYRVCYGSSEYGGCMKSQVAARLGYTPLATSERMQGLYDRGHEHEVECVAVMQAEGWHIDDRQGEYLIDCGNRVGVIVHVDGIGQRADAFHRNVVEIKAPSTWESFEKAYRTSDYSDPYMAKIAWQISAQMVATGLEAVIACTEDGRVKTFGIELPPFDATAIRHRVQIIENIVASGQLPRGCSQADYPCPFVYLHEEAEAPDHDPEMDALVVAYTQAADDEKAAKARKEAVREAVEARLAGETYHSNVGKVSRFGRVSTTYDTKQMMKDGMDIARYAKVNQATVLKITKGGIDEIQ